MPSLEVPCFLPLPPPSGFRFPPPLSLLHLPYPPSPLLLSFLFFFPSFPSFPSPLLFLFLFLDRAPIEPVNVTWPGTFTLPRARRLASVCERAPACDFARGTRMSSRVLTLFHVKAGTILFPADALLPDFPPHPWCRRHRRCHRRRCRHRRRVVPLSVVAQSLVANIQVGFHFVVVVVVIVVVLFTIVVVFVVGGARVLVSPSWVFRWRSWSSSSSMSSFVVIVRCHISAPCFTFVVVVVVVFGISGAPNVFS